MRRQCLDSHYICLYIKIKHLFFIFILDNFVCTGECKERFFSTNTSILLSLEPLIWKYFKNVCLSYVNILYMLLTLLYIYAVQNNLNITEMAWLHCDCEKYFQ